MRKEDWLKGQCHLLWKEAFGDNDEFIADFLTNYFNEKNFLYVEQENRIVSMLHIIPFELNDEPVAYIYAVATATHARGRGLATELMNRAIEKVKNEGYKAVATLPADRELQKFYEKFGFRGEYNVEFFTADGFDFGTGEKSKEIITVLSLNSSFTMPSKKINLIYRK